MNIDAVKAYVAAQAIVNAGDQDNEDHTNTVIEFSSWPDVNMKRCAHRKKCDMSIGANVS